MLVVLRQEVLKLMLQIFAELSCVFPLQNLRWVDVIGWGRSLGLCRRLWLDVRLLGRRCRHW